ncbi:MAG: hypothetical protein KAV25_09090 [Methanophagales archaeon]|nr:hypothetical protein [Methanophagales archaeon]
MNIGAMIAIFTLISAIGSVNAGVSFSYTLSGNCDIKANDNYKCKIISYEAKSSIKEVQYSFNALGINSDNSSLYHSLSTTKAKGLETNSIFNFNYAAAEGNSMEGGVMDMTENIGLTSIYSGYGSGLLPLIPASYEEVNAYSKVTGTNVLAATITKVGITEKDPVGLQYKIDAEGQKEGSWANGKVSAGVSMYAVDGSKWSYEEESTASGSFEFYKVIDYTSKITTP